MKIKSFILGIAALTLVSTVQAVPLNLTVSGGVSVVAAPKSDLGNFGDATVLSWMTTDIAAYNLLNATAFAAPQPITGSIGLTGGAGGTSFTIALGGFDYLFLHWGGQGGGWAQLFYVGNLTGNYTFDNSAMGEPPTVGGLSHYSLYNRTNVPDGGATALMLGAALAGIGAIRRFKK